LLLLQLTKLGDVATSYCILVHLILLGKERRQRVGRCRRRAAKAVEQRVERRASTKTHVKLDGEQHAVEDPQRFETLGR